MNYSEENFPKKLQKVLIKVECRGFMVIIASLREKCPNTEFFSGPCFAAFSPNTG